MSNSAHEAGIPVLTEVIADDEHFIAPPKPQATAPAPAPAVHATPVQPVSKPVPRPEVVDVPLIDGWLTEEWNRLERKIGGRILQQVMASVEQQIEDRVRDALADVLQMSIESMANELKHNLRGTLEVIIAQAVHQEISDMQIAKK